jgi:hypothetical protein
MSKSCTTATAIKDSGSSTSKSSAASPLSATDRGPLKKVLMVTVRLALN